MPNPNEKNESYWITQSEMLQNIVDRMANNSLEIKKVGLTVWATIVGFGVTNNSPPLFLLALVSFLLFGILDIYYLYLERKFRRNFNRLARIISGYRTSEDIRWIESMKGNFLIPDMSTNFLDELPNTIKSWANLPYLITALISILLFSIPVSSSP